MLIDGIIEARRPAAVVAAALLILCGLSAAQAADGARAHQPLIWRMSLAQDAKQWTTGTARLTTAGLRLEIISGKEFLELRRELKTGRFDTLSLTLEPATARELTGRLVWDLGQGYHPKNGVSFNYGADGRAQLRVPLAESPRWIGTIKGLRFYPATTKSVVTVSSIKLLYRGQRATPRRARVRWIRDVNVRDTLETTNRPVLIYVFALESAGCRKLARTVLSEPQFVKATRDFVCIRLLAQEAAKYKSYVGPVAQVPMILVIVRDPTTHKFVELERVEGYHTLDQLQRYFDIIKATLKSRRDDASESAP
ncbi:hypothetical protein ACFL34_06125 [Candidatus Sumerlaeota bacterium]